MDYAQQQRNPAKHLVGLTVVVLLHVALVYVIMTGLARKVVDVIKKPLETQIIEEVKPPPPPPPPVQLPPPPKFVAPPPPYIPPPEVQVNVPPPPTPIAVATTVVPVGPPPPIAAVAPPPAPPAPAPAAPTSARTACVNYVAAIQANGFPGEASRKGIDHGSALIRFTVTASGEIKDITAVNSSNSIFARAAIESVKTLKCAGQGRDILFEIPFDYRTN